MTTISPRRDYRIDVMKNYRATETPSMDCNPASIPIAGVPSRNRNPNLLASGGQRTARPTLPVAASRESTAVHRSSKCGALTRRRYRKPKKVLALTFQGAVLLIASLTALLLASPPVAFAADTTDSLLQKGLFEEEANHNLPEAIKAYEAVVAQTDQQRKLAATAIFRLGECYRKLGKTNDAATYYQRVVRDFADQELLVKFSRQLLGHGAASGSVSNGPAFEDRLRGVVRAADPEADRIRALTATFRDNPDLVNAPDSSLRTPLHEAAQQGQSRVVAFLLTNGAHLEVRDNNGGQTPLLVATRTGSKDVVEQLLRAKANPNTADAGGATPAHFAAHQAMRGILELLIQAGANVNARGHFRHDGNFADQTTPLHIAAGRGYRSVAELLIDSKADINARDSRGQTPLHTASILGQDPVCELLLKRGANINAADNSQRTPLHFAARQHFSIVEALLKESAEINARDSGGWTPLFLAVENRQVEIVQLLLKNKAEVNVTGRGETPLLIAVRLKAIDIAELLLEAGADVNARHTQGYSVINAAAEELRMLGVVLKFKPDLEAQNSNGYTPLLDAVANGRPETVKLLLEAGADPNNAYLREGAPPLHFAASKGFTDIAALLLAHKADPNIVNAHGRTAFDNVGASTAGYFRPPPPLPAQFPGAPTASGQVPARVARAPSPDPVAADADKIRELLLKHGADTNIARRGAIAVTRNDRNDWVPSRWFSRETHPHNRFTLFELIASFYDSQVNANTTLVFPDLQRLRILRLGTNGANEEFQLNVAALLREGDCSKDIWLQWGDVVSIPEQEHRLNESWQGFESALIDSLTNCLRRTVHVVIKGKTNELTRGPQRMGMPLGKPGVAQFWLSQILYNSALLLSTSDTSRVKVYRTDPITKEKLELDFDFSRSPYPSDLWLRHGDVIEVPEKPAATAKADQP
jgi:ankyrin repeat protein